MARRRIHLVSVCSKSSNRYFIAAILVIFGPGLRKKTEQPDFCAWAFANRLDNEPEATALTVFAFNANRAAVLLDDRFADGQAKSGAFFAGLIVDLMESFEINACWLLGMPRP